MYDTIQLTFCMDTLKVNVHTHWSIIIMLNENNI